MKTKNRNTTEKVLQLLVWIENHELVRWWRIESHGDLRVE